MTEREALKMALEALETLMIERGSIYDKAITAIKEALAQPEQEPKCGAIIEVFGKDWRLDFMSLPVGKHKLYAQQYTYNAPPQRKPLTDEEIRDLWSWSATAEAERTATTQQHAFARAIEAAHGIKEKNT